MAKGVFVFFIIILSAMSSFSQYSLMDLWNERDELAVDWATLNEGQKVFVLEKYREEIDYCIANLGRRFNDIDISKIGNSKGYEEFNKIGSGLVALKYLDDYHNPIKAIEYFEKAWVSYKKCNSPKSVSVCDWPFFDETPLGFIIGISRDAGLYKKSLTYYPEAYEDMIRQFSIGTDIKLLKSNFSQYRHNWPEEAKIYREFMADWDNTKKLAKTTNPKPLDPAVQHHEWFYSEKREEVLKALAYYHQHNVRFMLEKASKHKDSIIAAKAKEYLQNPVKEVASDEAKNVK